MKTLIYILTLLITVVSFSQNVVIDKFYNYEIVEGVIKLTEVSPQSDTYIFDSSDIVQGVVSDEIALTNKETLNEAILDAKENGYNIFSIDNIDAYFDIRAENYNRSTSKSIILQSDMHFKMGSNCTLKIGRASCRERV